MDSTNHACVPNILFALLATQIMPLRQVADAVNVEVALNGNVCETEHFSQF